VVVTLEIQEIQETLELRGTLVQVTLGQLVTRAKLVQRETLVILGIQGTLGQKATRGQQGLLVILEAPRDPGETLAPLDHLEALRDQRDLEDLLVVTLDPQGL
jgi:hypothetical protein